MSKTKEDILNKIAIDFNKRDGELVYSFKQSEIENAMDEYSKQEAIGFAKWVSFNDWIDCETPNGWVCTKKTENEYLTDTQLYDLYQKSKQP